jgi:uncharacterized protein YndB with AHSA1/START domain
MEKPMPTEMNAEGMGTARIELELPIAASCATVWDCMVNRIADWWRRDFFVYANARFVLEPKVGGLMYEDTGDGHGFVWYVVHGIEKEKSLYLIGHMRPPYGGPTTSMLLITLEDVPEGTLLKLSDCEMGKVSKKHTKSLDDGWKLLFDELKRLAEE